MNSQTKYNEMTEFDKLPKEIQERMFEYQVEQGNKRDADVFRECLDEEDTHGGIDWCKTEEGWLFWHEILDKHNHALFFERYPKKSPLKDAIQEVKANPAEAIKVLQEYAKQFNLTVEVVFKSK
jgi:hypothetical protein